MTGDLQRIVDSLGYRLHRAVAIDDRHWRLVAYNSHPGPVDQIRRDSILTRKAPTAATTRVERLGIARAQKPIRVPANQSIGMDARVCAAVRSQGKLLGFLTLIDKDLSLDDQALEVIQSAADAAGLVVYREELLSDLERAQERELLRDLLAERPEVRQQGAQELVEANILACAGPVSVVVVAPTTGDGEPLDDNVRAVLRRSLEEVRHLSSPRHSLQLARPDHGLVVVLPRDAAFRVKGVDGLATELQRRLSELLSEKNDHLTAVAGVGESQSALVDAHVSYAQALQACRVARIVPSFGPVASWSCLGIYRTLLQFPLGALTSGMLHSGFLALIREPSHRVLVETLNCYLELGCDAKTTAQRLHLHRTTLYHRLRKIEEIARIDLRTGDDRLAMHLDLKLARLAGMWPVPSVAD